MKISKYAAIAMAVFTILFLLSGTAAAFSGTGTGTTADPYQITTVDQLKEIKSGLSNSYILMNDIEITESTWSAIGNNSAPFTGMLNGNGQKITFNNPSGITFARSGSNNMDGYGLFGQIKGTSKLENVTIVVASNLKTGGNYTGVLVGVINGTSSSKPSITNCSVTKLESGGTVSLNGSNGGTVAVYHTGALIGRGVYTTIQNCYSDLNVTASPSYNYNVGGLIGYLENSSVIECFATGDIWDTRGEAAGLVGSIDYTTIERSYATGNVTSRGNASGFVGVMYLNSIISNCYATGSATTTVNGGYTGGLIGNGNGGTVKTSYSTGKVTGIGTSNSGGFIGYTYFLVSSSGNFYDTTTAEKSDSKNATPKTTADMMKSTTFTGWDISNESLDKIWYIYEDESYPRLSALHQPETISVGLKSQPENIGSGKFLRDYNGEMKAWTLNADYVLDANIDMEGASLDPIGTENEPFTGTFKGDEDFAFAISDFSVVSTGNNVGFFGVTENAKISNIHLIDAVIEGNRNVGGLIGHANGVTEISESSVTGTVTAAANHAGSFVGFLSDGSLVQCYSDCDVFADSEAGGLVGAMKGGLIDECYATGAVVAETEVAGGLVAEYGDALDLTISNSFALNEEVSSPLAAGRIIGVIAGTVFDLIIDDVYAWDEMENLLGLFDDVDAENGDDVESADVWNTFGDSGSVWENFDVSVWMLGTNEDFLLPIFLYQDADMSGDASHLIPVPATVSKTSGGGSGTGSATVVDTTSAVATDASGSSSSGAAAETSENEPVANTPQGENQGFGSDGDGDEGGSNKMLIGILAAGLVIVGLCVCLYLKGRKF
ncbi:hypothetical protein MmiEs2_15910 [Methanimicrococcus stummii]|uniref:GLUG domain-containing protein n=1 Tax=Methanimicrococcus stummii TaxID=3028294 RepID=A0AA96V9P6_9EURY|nr:GLUG motif-containing protein [Methanimicrococcus sp. Es2]WNY29364.1 hypothetical protein MmiEs2_15910 [Methanimicrococcus sp. Es2]